MSERASSPSETVTPLGPELLRGIVDWTEQDPDPQTRQQVSALLSAAGEGSAAAGAARAPPVGGPRTRGSSRHRRAPNRMTRGVGGQAAAGLATYLLDAGRAGGRVVIGYDARHSSDVFARDTAEILAGAGFGTLLTERPLPTPVVAFGIRHLDCVAGVVVTASHNPPEDNGYKVYLGDGSQIVPPADQEIAARILEVARHRLDDVPRSPVFTTVGEELVAAYVARAAGLVAPEAPRELAWVYTPLHGVGGSVVERVVAAAGFPAATTVTEQATPDPDFPTVPFPNPEEPGAIDLAVALAERAEVDLVVANDPDADRCAVATVVDGAWRMLSGDELGALLGDYALRRGVRGTYACSVVSSSLLETMAAAYGQPFTTTLTGFKWIGRVPGLVFGYEEAIGYCVDPAAVPDKDGISALVRVLGLAAELKATGSSLAARLDEIARRYGVHGTDQLSVRVADLDLIGAAMARVRADPPTRLDGESVTVTDLAEGGGDLPPTDAVLLSGPSVKVVVRPSGTEPKLKCYLEARRPPDPAEALDQAREQVRARLTRLRAEMATALGLS